MKSLVANKQQTTDEIRAREGPSGLTPGPWWVDVHRNVLAPGGKMVAFPCIQDGLNEWANARLIAAAPELLEACQMMAEWFAREEDHAVDFYARMELCRRVEELTAAAIAKAS